MQIAFDFSGLVCAFGEPWLGPHPRCDAEADRLEAEFWANVQAGIYDETGYMPKERKAQPPCRSKGKNKC